MIQSKLLQRVVVNMWKHFTKMSDGVLQFPALHTKPITYQQKHTPVRVMVGIISKKSVEITQMSHLLTVINRADSNGTSGSGPDD